MPSLPAAARTVRSVISSSSDIAISTEIVLRRDDSTRISLDDQPDLSARGEGQGLDCGRRDVNHERHPGIDARDDRRAFAHERDDSSVNDVSGAEATGRLVRQENVAGT